MADTDTDTLDELRRPTFANDKGDQTATFLAKEYPTAEDAQAAGIDPAYYTEQTGVSAVAQPAAEPAEPTPPAPATAAPVPAWESIASHPEFQKLSPEAQHGVIDQYAQKAREFATSLPGAPAPDVLDSHFAGWSQKTKDFLGATPEQKAAAQIDVGAGPGRAPIAPEGSPEAAIMSQPTGVTDAQGKPVTYTPEQAHELAQAREANQVPAPPQPTAGEQLGQIPKDIFGPGWDYLATPQYNPTPIPADPKDNTLVGFGKAMANEINGFISGFTSPAMAATLGAGAVPGIGKYVAAGFLGDIARHTPEMVEQVKAMDKMPVGSQEWWQAGLGVTVQLAFAGTIGKHILTKAPVEVVQAAANSKEPAVAGAAKQELTARGIGQVPQEQLTKALSQRTSDQKLASDAAQGGLVETSNVILEKATADYDASTKKTPAQAHADELANFHETPEAQAAGEAEAKAPDLTKEQPTGGELNAKTEVVQRQGQQPGEAGQGVNTEQASPEVQKPGQEVTESGGASREPASPTTGNKPASKPPEQMSPEDWKAREPSAKANTFTAPRLDHQFYVDEQQYPSGGKYYSAFDSTTGLGTGKEFKTIKEAKAAIESDFGLTDKQVAYNKSPKGIFSEEGLAYNKKYSHGGQIEQAAKEQKPLNAEAVEQYGIKLPEGYTKEGDQYVFKGEKNIAKTAQPTEQAAVGKTETPKTSIEQTSASITPADYSKHLPNVEWPFGAATESVPFDKVEVVNQGSKSGVGSKQASWTVKLRNQGNIVSDESFGGKQIGKQAAERFAKEMQSRLDTGARPVSPSAKPETFEQRMAREEDVNDWIKSANQSKQPAKTADEAWQKYTAFDRSRGVEVPGEDYFKNAWELFNRKEAGSKPAETTAIAAETPAKAETNTAPTGTAPEVTGGAVGKGAASPTDLAHTVKTDLGKQINVPKGATAVRVTDAKGRKIVVRAAELKGANVLEGAGPFKKIEAGTIASKGKDFLPMKEKVEAKEAAAEKPAGGTAKVAPKTFEERRVLRESWNNLGAEALLKKMDDYGIPAKNAKKVWEKARNRKPGDETDWDEAFYTAASDDMGAWEKKAPKATAKSAAASGITAPGIASRVAEYLTRGGLEDEELAKHNVFEPTVKDVEASEEPATAGSSEEAAPSAEAAGIAAQSAVKEWTTAHEQATYQAVTDALSREGGTKGVGTVAPDLADQVSKRYATVNKAVRVGLDKWEVSDPAIAQAARENAYNILRDDLLANARQTGDPFTTKTASGKEVKYAASLRAQTKTDQFLDLHENKNTRGEEADIASEITAAPKDSTRYHEAVNYVLDATDGAINDFSNRVGFEGHSPEAIDAAVQTVMKEQGFGTGVQGRPSKEAQEVLSKPNFREAVQKNVFQKIAEAVRSHVDDSVFDDLRLNSSGNAIGQALVGIASLFKPGKMTHLGNVARGWFGAIAGRTLPRFTAVDREVGESGARYISSQIAAEPMATLYASKVIEGLKVPAFKLGAALTEDNLRDVKAQNLAKAAQAATPEEAQEYQDRAANTASMVGKGKTFRDEAEYQKFLADPETQQAIQRHKALWDQQIDPLYKQAQRIDPNEQLPPRGVQTGARVNLLPVEKGQKAVRKVAGAPSGGLTNTLRKKSPFAVEAKGTADHYETDYREIMANTFGRQLSIANYNGFVDAIVDKGLGQIGKPGQTIEIDGEGTTSFPLARRTIIQTGEGKTQVFAANQSLYVKNSLAGEFRNAVNVDPGAVTSALAKYAFRPLNNAALYGLTDATVHVSNLATRLFTMPAATGTTLTDSFLSTFGRADIPVVLTKAIIKGFQDNKAQTAELANIGALRAESKSTTWGLGWSNKLIHWADKTVRLVSDDSYKQLVKEGLLTDTETNRREFVNMVGQYNRRTSSGLNRVMKDAGLAPFVTAGTTFNRLGLRTVSLQAGVQHTTALAHAMTMTNIATKWVGAAVLIGTTNYLLTHNKGGGVLGRPGVPLGNIDTGRTDENGKPLSLPAGDIIGLSRGLRVTGIKGAVQAKRAGLTAGDVKDAALRDVVNTVVSPYAGPSVRFGSAVLFNRSPGIGTPPVNHIVPPTGDDSQKSQIAHNILRGLADINPAVSAYVAKQENPSLPTAEVMKRQLPRFTLRPSNAIDMMENYPEIVHKAQINSYVDDTIYTARRLKPADRAAYIEQQMSQIPADDQPRLEKALKSRRVEY